MSPGRSLVSTCSTQHGAAPSRVAEGAAGLPRSIRVSGLRRAPGSPEQNGLVLAQLPPISHLMGPPTRG